MSRIQRSRSFQPTVLALAALVAGSLFCGARASAGTIVTATYSSATAGSLNGDAFTLGISGATLQTGGSFTGSDFINGQDYQAPSVPYETYQANNSVTLAFTGGALSTPLLVYFQGLPGQTYTVTATPTRASGFNGGFASSTSTSFTPSGSGSNGVVEFASGLSGLTITPQSTTGTVNITFGTLLPSAGPDVPELDAMASMGALTVLASGLAMMRGRRKSAA